MIPTKDRTLSIGNVARLAGVTIDTIRYYEKRGLIHCPERKPTWHGPGHRRFHPDVVRRIHFIKKAQQLGFSLVEIGELLDLRDSPPADRDAVRRQVDKKLKEINEKLVLMTSLQKALVKLQSACQTSNSLCTCPILEALGDLDGIDGDLSSL